MNWMNYGKAKLRAARDQSGQGSMDLIALSMPESPVRQKTHANGYNVMNTKTRPWPTPRVGLATVVEADAATSCAGSLDGRYGSVMPHTNAPTETRTESASVIANTEQIDQDVEFYHFLQASPRRSVKSKVSSKLSKKRLREASPETSVMAASIVVNQPSPIAAPQIVQQQSDQEMYKELMSKIKAGNFQVMDILKTIGEMQQTIQRLEARIETFEKCLPDEPTQMVHTVRQDKPVSQQDSIQDEGPLLAASLVVTPPPNPPKKLVSILELQPTKTRSDIAFCSQSDDLLGN